MFDFGRANESQIEAIKTTEGTLLIIAGPGTGKTFTLVQRAIYLIQEKGVAPEQIMIATFIDKAAKELITRISNALLERNIKANINEMYVGTFHSICMRFLKEHLEYITLKKNYRILDAFDQNYMVEENMYHFNNINNIDLIQPVKGVVWKKAEIICEYVNKLQEEFVTAEQLLESQDETYQVLGYMMEKYEKLLKDQNYIDFTRIQTEVLEKKQQVTYDFNPDFGLLNVAESSSEYGKKKE